MRGCARGTASVALACALALVAAACGGDDDSGSATGATVDAGVKSGVQEQLGGSTTSAAATAEAPDSMEAWEELCRHVAPQVRSAAAEAAATGGSAAHLPLLAELCRDPVADVRLSAYVAFRTLEPEAAKTGYDHREPQPAALEALDRLAGNGRQASAGPDER